MRNPMPGQHFSRRALALAVALAGLPLDAAAMSMLADEEMSSVNAQDGIQITLSAVSYGGGNALWDVDTGVTAVGAFVIDPEAYIVWEDVDVQAVDVDGNLLATPATNVITLDVGGDQANTSAGMGITSTWSRVRTQVNAFKHELTGANSTGTFAFDSSGSLSLRNRNGLFFDGSNSADFSLSISDASLYFRQGPAGSPEVLFDNILFNPSFTNGKIGLNANGLNVEASTLNFNLTFDLRYQGSVLPAQAFTYSVADDRPIMYYGWQGALTNFQLGISGGGIWYGSTLCGGISCYDTANRSQGIRFTGRWDYDPSFAWVVGESNPSGTGLPRARIVFDQWQKIGTGYTFEFPNNVLDVVKAGQGPGGLCWGSQISHAGTACPANTGQYFSQFVNITPEDGVALISRDARNMAYNTRVIIQDDFTNNAGTGGPDGDYGDTAVGVTNVVAGTTETQTVNWGLIYTLGNFDANIYFYPGGWDFNTATATATGLKTDFVIMTQSHDGADADVLPDWTTGSHYMIADTDTNFGIGFMNSSVLLAANDLYITMASDGLNFRLRNGATPGQARVQFKGRFGGGDLPNMLSPVRGFDINANFETNNFSFTLEPPLAGQVYIGYKGFVDLVDLGTANFAENGTSSTSGDDGTFLSLAEPSQPAADFRLANITGRLAWRDGRIDLVSDSEATPTAQPAKLVNSATIDVGSTGGGAALQIGRVEFGNANLGSIVLPSGTFYSAFGFKRQL